MAPRLSYHFAVANGARKGGLFVLGYGTQRILIIVSFASSAARPKRISFSFQWSGENFPFELKACGAFHARTD
jgi:hypothetical protein